MIVVAARKLENINPLAKNIAHSRPKLVENNGVFGLTLDDMSRQAATPAATLSAV